MASEGRRLTRNRRSRFGTWPLDGSSVSMWCEQPRAVDAGERGWADLPATTRPRQRVQPEAAGGRVAPGRDRQSDGLVDRGERGGGWRTIMRVVPVPSRGHLAGGRLPGLDLSGPL